MTIRAFQCFASGTRTAMDGRTVTISDMEVEQIASNYSRATKAAPLVLGHPADDIRAPSLGTVEGLVAQKGQLFAIADVSPELVELVSSGRYKNVSSSFDMPSGPGNPTPGAYYLRHVGFLGAVPPAVKGMQPLAFAATFTTFEEALEQAQEAVNFAAWGVATESPDAQLYRVAKDLHRALPDLRFVDAASLAQRALQSR